MDFGREYGLVFSILYLHLVIQDLIFLGKKYVNVCPRFICSNYNDLIMVLGSLGIIVIEDLKDKKFKFNKLKLQTKIVIIFTVILLVVPTIMVKIYDS